MNALSIAGSDPSSGAGIQGDVKTFFALGVHGLTVITALTSQNTSKFFKANPVSPSTVRNQIRAVLSDFKIDIIKIGMVYDSQIIKVIRNELRQIKSPIILDPIFESTTGGTLLCKDAFETFKKILMPMAFVITPNIPEAERITKMKIITIEDLKRAAVKIKKMGPKNVVIKGGHMRGEQVTDLLLENDSFHFFSNKKIETRQHGSGCVFSAALCVAVARRKSLIDAVKFAQKMSLFSIKNSTKAGRGLAIIEQKNPDLIEKELNTAINKLIKTKNMYKFIPECQTNFVYSKPRPNSFMDILGVEGRIVKTGDSVVVAGGLKYGSSKHVASAVLELSRKFPNIRSALNIRYDSKIIEKAITRGFDVSSYDRSFEPEMDKSREGTTISWGIKNAIEKLQNPPDIIYHRGDIGKEPMILIFGKKPNLVFTKLIKIMI